MSKETITRRGYINTHSEAGRPEPVTFKADSVIRSSVWINSYGNPTHMLYLDNGDTLLCVDDYGAMNNIYHISARTVTRRKDL